MNMRPGINLVCSSVLFTRQAKILTFEFNRFMESSSTPSTAAASMLLPTNFKIEAKTTQPALSGIAVGGSTIIVPYNGNDYADMEFDMVATIGDTRYVGSVDTAELEFDEEVVMMKEAT